MVILVPLGQTHSMKPALASQSLALFNAPTRKPVIFGGHEGIFRHTQSVGKALWGNARFSFSPNSQPGTGGAIRRGCLFFGLSYGRSLSLVCTLVRPFAHSCFRGVFLSVNVKPSPLWEHPPGGNHSAKDSRLRVRVRGDGLGPP